MKSGYDTFFSLQETLIGLSPYLYHNKTVPGFWTNKDIGKENNDSVISGE